MRYGDNRYDKFYATPEVAKLCIDSIDISEYDTIVEPSAGDGSFYNQINHKNKIGIDIMPECEGLIEQDFIKWTPDTNNKILTIGGPPWGVRGKLALEFINHSFKFSDTVAFILPCYFDPKRRLPEQAVRPNYKIINSFTLPDFSFTYYGKPKSYGSVFITYKKF
jgi:hypothetical protein